MARRCIVRRNNHSYGQRLRRIVSRANQRCLMRHYDVTDGLSDEDFEEATARPENAPVAQRPSGYPEP